MTFASRIAGIPCLIEVTHYHREEPRGYWASNDVDARGYTECEFNVLDQRGRPAAWLERKVTDADRTRIVKELRIKARGEDY